MGKAQTAAASSQAPVPLLESAATCQSPAPPEVRTGGEALEKGSKGFLAWLIRLDEKELQIVFNDMVVRSSDPQQLTDFVSGVESSQTTGLCGRCRFTWGCDQCNYKHALVYAIRWERPPPWYFKARGKALSLSTRD